MAHGRVAFAPEAFPDPVIGPCAYRTATIRVLRSDGDNVVAVLEPAWLLPNHGNYALQKIREKQPIALGERGEIVYCRMLSLATAYAAGGEDRDGMLDADDLQSANTYQEVEQIILVKKLRRWIIDPLIQQNRTQENPYREIAALQFCGDDRHAVRIFPDALKTDRYLFILMNYLPAMDLRQSFLDGELERNTTVPELARLLLQDLHYLEQHAIIHRDISVENVLWCTRDRSAPLIDLAMSLRAVRLEQVTQKVTPQHWCGKLPYTSPESIQRNDQGEFTHPLDCGVDVWSMGVVLVALTTGMRLWDRPSAEDLAYSIFVIRGALGRHPEQLEPVLEFCLQHSNETDDARDLIRKLQHVQNLDMDLRQLLGRMLTEDPDERPSAQELLQTHPFLQQEQ